MKRIFRMAAVWATTLAVVLCSAAARAQILDQVPADALVVFKIKNLAAVNEKAAALAKQFGLVEMTPEAADPLSSLLAQANITKGVDKAGDAAVVLANGNLDGEIPPMLILIPVTDYKEFLGNFGEAKNEGGVDSFKMKVGGAPDGEETFAANWGKYAVITPMKELLAKKPEGFKLAAAATNKELATRDAVAVVNFKVLGPILIEKLKGGKEKLMGEMEKGLAQAPNFNPKYLPLLKVTVGQLFSVAEGFLVQTQAVTYGINLSKDGISTSFMAEFDPASYAGKMFAGITPATGSLLAGLPAAKYLFFGGSVNNGENSAKVMDDFLKPIDAELTKAGDDLKPVSVFIDSVKKLSVAQKAATVGMIAPSGALGASALFQVVAITQGDAKTLMELQQKMVQSQQDLMGLIPNNPSGNMKVTVTPNAKTIDGVSFTQITTAPDANDTSPQAMQIKQMMAIMYGGNGPTFNVGAVDDQHMVSLSGIDDTVSSAAIKAIKENQDNLSKTEGVAFVNKNLPEKKVGVFYIAVDEIVTTVTNYAKMMGMPIPVNMKPNLPPIGVAIATDGPSMRVDSFIPADLIEALITTSLQLRVMGGGRGKPGGL